MNPLHLLWIIPLSFWAGMLLMAIFASSKQSEAQVNQRTGKLMIVPKIGGYNVDFKGKKPRRHMV